MNNPQAEFQHAFGLHQRGQLDAAEKIYRSILRSQPKYFDAIYALGIVHLQRNEFERAERQFSLAVKLNPNNGPLHNNRGSALLGMNRLQDALASYDRAISLQPQNPEARYNRGNVLAALTRFDDALASYDSSIALFPGTAAIYNNRGSALAALGRYNEAIASFDRAIQLNAGDANAFGNRGSAHAYLRQFDKSAEDFDRALALNPTLNYAVSDRLASKMRLCRWDEYEQNAASVIEGIRHGNLKAEPFSLLAIPATAEDQKKCAEAYILDKAPAGERLWRGERYPHDRIRIGYVSSDLHNHATAYLFTGVLEAHDRSKFHITAFSTGEGGEDDYRKRIRAACDEFLDVRSLRLDELAKRIRASEIDILLDMHGHTAGRVIHVFAARPAPVQVNFLGYPGTTGASYIDYLIADRHVIPDGAASAYSEKIVYLPDSYQPNDLKRFIEPRSPTRQEQGLPDSGFVFCSFNSNYKITPDIFDVWMRLLQSVDGSVLWLFRDNMIAGENLKREAEKRGVSAGRLVFAERLPLGAHLARHQLADLFLDTRYYNAHTTASDALWAGLPLVTCPHSTFAGRVATSLLHAIGLPELATNSMQDYEQFALKLAANPDMLRAIKSKLMENRNTSPLFDTRRYTRHIEAAYLRMWEHAQKGKAPQSFSVEPISRDN